MVPGTAWGRQAYERKTGPPGVRPGWGLGEIGALAALGKGRRRTGGRGGAVRAEGEAKWRKAEKQKPVREREKGPDRVSWAWGKGRKAEQWGGHMKLFSATGFYLPGQSFLPLSQGAPYVQLENKNSHNASPVRSLGSGTQEGTN